VRAMQSGKIETWPEKGKHNRRWVSSPEMVAGHGGFWAEKMDCRLCVFLSVGSRGKGIYSKGILTNPPQINIWASVHDIAQHPIYIFERIHTLASYGPFHKWLTLECLVKTF
jgi:hypothetical protein